MQGKELSVHVVVVVVTVLVFSVLWRQEDFLGGISLCHRGKVTATKRDGMSPAR